MKPTRQYITYFPAEHDVKCQQEESIQDEGDS